MLRHFGNKRTYNHNVKLASLLSVTAGFVNASGFLGFSVLTTNVTGHVASFAERIAFKDWRTARVIALWMFLFLAGAFVSGLIISRIGRNQRFSYVIPIFVEISILIALSLCGDGYDRSLIAKEIFAGSLLFAMGLQNSLVSMVSGNVVRTTHLTGTFTDLGIELAQYLQKDNIEAKELTDKIKLRLTIIGFFMVGAMFGAYLFRFAGFMAFLFPAFILTFTLIYDVSRLRIRRYLRR